MRYFNNDQSLLNSVVQIAQQRVLDGSFVTDISDISGLDVREEELTQLARKSQLTPADIAGLSQDERRVLSQYLGLRTMQQSNPDQFQETLVQLIRNSVRNANQILSLEVVE